MYPLRDEMLEGLPCVEGTVACSFYAVPPCLMMQPNHPIVQLTSWSISVITNKSSTVDAVETQMP